MNTIAHVLAAFFFLFFLPRIIFHVVIIIGVVSLLLLLISANTVVTCCCFCWWWCGDYRFCSPSLLLLLLCAVYGCYLVIDVTHPSRCGYYCAICRYLMEALLLCLVLLGRPFLLLLLFGHVLLFMRLLLRFPLFLYSVLNLSLFLDFFFCLAFNSNTSGLYNRKRNQGRHQPLSQCSGSWTQCSLVKSHLCAVQQSIAEQFSVHNRKGGEARCWGQPGLPNVLISATSALFRHTMAGIGSVTVTSNLLSPAETIFARLQVCVPHRSYH